MVTSKHRLYDFCQNSLKNMLVLDVLLALLTATTVVYAQVQQENVEAQRGSTVSRDALRERLDSMLLILNRMSDRLVALQTKSNQQSERLDNINYRITKLELINEERKSDLSEVSNALRHRLQTAENMFENIQDSMDQLKQNTDALTADSAQMTNSLSTYQGSGVGSKRIGNRVQALATLTYAIKGTTQSLARDMNSLIENATNVETILNEFSESQSQMATKKDLLAMMADLESKWMARFIAQPRALTGNKIKRDPTDCWEWLHKRGQEISGIYRIQPQMSHRPFFVYCDMETDGGGWTVIQRRTDGSIDFLRGWIEYKHGFGNLGGEFWLGNEQIHLITTENVNELLVQLADFSQTYETANYSAFAIGSQAEGYALKLLGSYSGTAGDGLGLHVGQQWSTIDMDNDAHPDENCARQHTGAWWYKACDSSNLNGRYLHGPIPPEHEYQGMYWYGFNGPQYSLWRSTMMVRRGGHVTASDEAPPPIQENRYAVHNPELMDTPSSTT